MHDIYSVFVAIWGNKKYSNGGKNRLIKRNTHFKIIPNVTSKEIEHYIVVVSVGAVIPKTVSSLSSGWPVDYIQCLVTRIADWLCSTISSRVLTSPSTIGYFLLTIGTHAICKHTWQSAGIPSRFLRRCLVRNQRCEYHVPPCRLSDQFTISGFLIQRCTDR